MLRIAVGYLIIFLLDMLYEGKRNRSAQILSVLPPPLPAMLGRRIQKKFLMMMLEVERLALRRLLELGPLVLLGAFRLSEDEEDESVARRLLVEVDERTPRSSVVDILLLFVRRGNNQRGLLEAWLLGSVMSQAMMSELMEVFDFAGVPLDLSVKETLEATIPPGPYGRHLKFVELPFGVEGFEVRSQADASQLLLPFVRLESWRWIEYFAKKWSVCLEVLCDALAKEGKLCLLKKAREILKAPWDRDTTMMAAGAGHLNVVEYLVSEECPTDRWTVAAAAENGHAHIVRYLYSQERFFDSTACKAAAKGGHLDLFKWILERTSNCDPEKCATRAAKVGHLHIVRWLQQDALTESVCAAAAHGNQLETLMWLRFKKCPWDAETTRRAADRGHLKILEYCQREACPWTSETVFWAARKGRFEALAFLLEKGCPYTSSASTAAAESGHFDCLKLLFDNNCPVDEHLLEGAARTGNLEIARWALSTTKVSWGPRTTYWAALGGHLDFISFALDHGCQVHSHTSAAAASKGFLHILDFLNQHDLFSEFKVNCAAVAAANGHIDVLHWLNNHDCCFQDASLHAAYAGQVDALAFLDAHGLPIDEPGCRRAALDNPRVLHWLNVQRHGASS